MKFLKALILLCLIYFPCLAQNNYLKTDLLGPITTQRFNLSYENNFSEKRSFLITVDFGRYMKDKIEKNGQPFWEKSLTGFSIIPEYRFYPFAYSKNINPLGFFYGFYARYMNLYYMLDYSESSLGKETERASLYGIGALCGYKYQGNETNFYFEGLFGIGWGYSSLKIFKYDSFPNESLLWRYEISIGYQF